jgi:hypothetical protein
MKQYLIAGAVALMLLSSCGSSTKEKDTTLTDKRASLEKLKKRKSKTRCTDKERRGRN